MSKITPERKPSGCIGQIARQDCHIKVAFIATRVDGSEFRPCPRHHKELAELHAAYPGRFNPVTYRSAN